MQIYQQINTLCLLSPYYAMLVILSYLFFILQVVVSTIANDHSTFLYEWKTLGYEV
jgi:hypothetical protein